MSDNFRAIGLYGELSPELKGFVQRRLGNAHEAEDVVQEAFLRLHKSMEERPIENPKGFLYRITENLIVDRLRHRKHDDGPMEIDEDAMGPLGDSTPTPEDHLDKKQELAAVLAAVSTLPRRQKEVFLLSKVKGLTHTEIAEILGISKSTVEKHMMKALLVLDERLKPRGKGGANG